MTSGGGPVRLAFRPPPAGGRGALVISERTRNRIAAEAAAEAIRQAAPAPVGARPGAVVRVRRGSAYINLSIALPYPADIPALCAQVRRSVAVRCTELTGTPVRRVNVTVDRLERSTGGDGEADRTTPHEVRLERVTSGASTSETSAAESSGEEPANSRTEQASSADQAPPVGER